MKRKTGEGKMETGGGRQENGRVFPGSFLRFPFFAKLLT
jgi:hypothetical protein